MICLPFGLGEKESEDEQKREGCGTENESGSEVQYLEDLRYCEAKPGISRVCSEKGDLLNR